jgi:hypothetical protein
VADGSFAIMGILHVLPMVSLSGVEEFPTHGDLPRKGLSSAGHREGVRGRPAVTPKMWQHHAHHRHGHSALMLVAASLGHIVGSKWGQPPHLKIGSPCGLDAMLVTVQVMRMTGSNRLTPHGLTAKMSNQ